MSSEHRHHYWTKGDDGRYACDGCPEISEACIECQRWTGNSLLICERCVGRIRGLVDDIETALALYCPPSPSLITPTRYDKDRIRGTGLGEDGARWTIEDVRGMLASWAEMWAEAQDGDVTIGAAPYLRGHIWWAAHNRADSDWSQWLAEMRTALHVAKREAGLLPKRMPAPCAHCGGVAVQTWAHRLTPNPDGLSDEVTCLGCHLTWRSAAHYRQLSKQHLQALPGVQPDAIVTLDEARMVWPDVPAGTWRKWASRGELPNPVAWDVRARAQYRVGDLDVLAARRISETRRGRRAG